MNEEEKQLRRLKIEANRQQRKTSFCSTTDSETNSSDVSGCSENPLANEQANQSNLESSNLCDSFENDFMLEALENDSISAEQINQQIMEIENSFTSEDTHNHISDEVFEKVVDFELSVIPIPRPISQQKPNEFNEREIQVLSELLSATHLIRQPLTRITKEITNIPDLRKTMSYKYDRDIKTFVKAMKSLRGFNSLCEIDRIALLKDHCFAILLMRSVMFYNYETHYWTLFMVSLRIKIIKH